MLIGNGKPLTVNQSLTNINSHQQPLIKVSDIGLFVVTGRPGKLSSSISDEVVSLQWFIEARQVTSMYFHTDTAKRFYEKHQPKQYFT